MSVKQAEKCVKEAKEKMKGGFFSGMFSSKKDRIEEAVALYKEAAQQYKIAGSSKHYLHTDQESIDCLKSAANLCESMGDVGEAADMLSSAGDLEAKENPAGACELLKGAALMFIKSGKSADVWHS